MNWTLKRSLALVLTLSLIGLDVGRAQAMLAPADISAVQAVSIERSQDLQTIQSFLEKQQVHEKLADFGLNEKDIQMRLNNLSDKETHHIATRINTQNPAGDGGGAVITILLIGILVLLFVYLLKRV